MVLFDMKKLTKPKNLTPPSLAAPPLPGAAVQPPEAASPKAAVPPVSSASSVPADPSVPATGLTVRGASGKVAPTPGGVGDWRSHNFFFWFSIAGTVGTLFGVVLSWYFYQASQIKPLLTFGVHPVKTELQRPDYDKELGFIYKGKPLDSESITSVQVPIWNAGTRSIRDSDVLDPFRLVMPDAAEILSVRVKKSSRPICGFETFGNQEDYKSGTCPLKWRILEPGDGAVFQLIYAGSALRDPTLEGAVEGQRDGVAVEQYSLNFNRTGVEAAISIQSVLWTIILPLSICISLIFIAARIHIKSDAGKNWAEEKAAAAKHLAELQKRPVPVPPLVWALYAGALVCVLIVHAFVIRGSRPGPPFGW